MEKVIEKRLLRKLRNYKLSLEDLAVAMNVEEETVGAWLEELREDGVNVDEQRAHRGRKVLYHVNVLPDTGNVWNLSPSSNDTETLKFAATSDWHFASRFHLPKSWHESMKRTVDIGINRVYVAGDLMDGVNIYRGHLENLLAFSVEDQTDMVAAGIEKYPELTFYGISGNHDYSYTKQNGVKPLSMLEAKVDNFINLGDMRADVVDRGVIIRLLHGAGGRAYARSYPSQTYLRDYFSGLEKEDMQDLPQILMIGHYHTVYFGKDHGIFIMQSGSFQDGDNEYCIRRGLTGPAGLFHVESEVHRGKLDGLATNYVQPKAI